MFFFFFFQAEDRFIKGNERLVNNLNRTHFSLWCSNYWLTNRVRLIGAAVCAIVGGFLVASVSISFIFSIFSFFFIVFLLFFLFFLFIYFFT